MGSFHLHLISDSTGETVSTIARAALAQFDEIEVVEHNWSLVRTRGQIDKILKVIEERRGVVLYTLVKTDLAELLQNKCRSLSVPCVPVMDGVMGAFSGFLSRRVQQRPGHQHELDDEYFVESVKKPLDKVVKGALAPMPPPPPPMMAPMDFASSGALIPAS